MVITCPSCSARYRLNPDKIKGRGAKITCPKCEHVFVVFSDSDAEAPRPAAPSAPPRPEPPPAERRLDTTSGAFQAVGLDADDVSASTTGNIRVVAPGPRKTRRVRAMSRENIPVTQQIGGAEPAEASEGPSQEVSIPEMAEPRSASDLDFRSVGISTWKVKVSIGLIYDFSDISTLKKYLADKKVTEDDLISHNAKDWTRIGDIGDLDQHFIETWKLAKAAGASAKPKKEKKAASPTSTGSHNAVATGSYSTSTGNFAAQPSTRTGSHRTAGAATQRSGGKGRSKAPPPEEKNNNKLIAIAAAALLLLGGGWFFLNGQSDDAPAPSAAATTTETSPELEASETERIQQAIRDKLEKERREIEAREEEERSKEVVEEEEIPIQDRRDLVPVRPDQQVTPANQPDRRKMQKIQRRPPPTQRQPAQSGAAQTATKSANYATYLKVARSKLNGGNATKALEAFDKAIDANPKCRECYEGRAEAKKKLGDSAGAASDLAKAAAVGGGSARAGQ